MTATMKPLMMFEGYSAEEMYQMISHLLFQECKKYDDGTWRVILVPKQVFPPVNAEDAYILMQRFEELDTFGRECWLVVASDGEHPDSYSSLEDAMEAMEHEKASPAYEDVLEETMDDEERQWHREQHWADRKAIESDYIQLY
jgi:hypothetical protein